MEKIYFVFEFSKGWKDLALISTSPSSACASACEWSKTYPRCTYRVYVTDNNASIDVSKMMPIASYHLGFEKKF